MAKKAVDYVPVDVIREIHLQANEQLRLLRLAGAEDAVGEAYVETLALYRAVLNVWKDNKLIPAQ